MSGNGSKFLAWFIRPRQDKPGGAPAVPASTQLPDPPAPAKAIAPSAFVVLAARHLDPAEGEMQAGHVVTLADESAIRTVIGYVAQVNRDRR